MDKTQASIDTHNRVQRQYYERRLPEENWRIQPVQSSYIANHIDRIAAFGDLGPGERILDIGCGMGKYTLALAERGCRLEALDISPVLLQQLEAEAKGRFDIKLHCGDILDPSPELEGRFDVVVGFFMLHHLIDIAAAFRQVRKLLRKGGRVVFLDVNPLCPLYYLQITLSPTMSWRAEKGIVNLTRGQLDDALTAADFTAGSIERFGILPPVLRNRSFGPGFDRAFDALAFLKPVAAFQIIRAETA